MRYALIGCGRISPNHIAAAQQNGLDIVALVDIDESKSRGVLEIFDLSNAGISVYTDYKEMLEKERPELVAVADRKSVV